MSAPRLLLLASLLAMACKSSDRPGNPQPPPGSPQSPAPARFETREAWRLDIGALVPHDVVAFTDGRLLVGGKLSRETAIGGTTLAPVADTDVVLLHVDAGGAVKGHVALGAEGDNELEAMALVGDRVLAIVETRGKLHAGADTFAVRADTEDRIVVLVELDREKGPLRGRSLHRGPEVPSTRLLAMAGGDYIVSLSLFDGTTDRAVVTRYAADGKERWRRAFPGSDITQLFAAGSDRVAIGLRTAARLVVDITDAQGRSVGEHAIGKDTDAVSDHGDLQDAVLDGSTLWVFGETGGTVTLAGKRIERPALAIQPFALALEASNPPRWLDLMQGTGRVIGAHAWAGTIVVGFDVTHPPKSEPGLHRGLYLTTWSADESRRQRSPLHQVRYENDDWENSPSIPVSGTPLSADGMTSSGDAVVVWGTSCRTPCEHCACVAKVALSQGDRPATATTPAH